MNYSMAVNTFLRDNLLSESKSFKTLLSVDPKIQNRNTDTNTKQYRQMNEQEASLILRGCKQTPPHAAACRTVILVIIIYLK